MKIERLTRVSDDIVESLGQLMVQLAPDCKPLTGEYLQEIIDLPNIFLFVAKQGDQIVGTFSLVLYKIPTGLKASLEDVVVDVSMRGQKIGEKMIEFALEYANTQLEVSKLDLTSSPYRVAANALYRKLGFELRDTNVYRFEFK
ncbi:GNAT family N-acetyltransferase [Dysgonomonas sp. HDW5B]|uniref:GNAT family N-acetyltransferase n=1 Tax=Dysgonomonas sp. HDW5B TaxID=2714927 RepID=UPI00140E24C7|nr:GNAT family N-acetyltransferase [Dysgonomonas sp. HDW5B]QIK53732.1 GNAT family N-acetyltransferase [Dysgonomonas sp. HDW5B]